MKKISIFLLFCGLSATVMAQVGINTDSPDASSILHIESEPDKNQGVLLPRINLLNIKDAVTIPTPAKGLMVFNTNKFMGEGIYVNRGTSTNPDWALIGLEKETVEREVKVLSYLGATDPNKTLIVDMFEFRFLKVGARYRLEFKLNSAPASSITVTRSPILNWRNAQREVTPYVTQTFTTANWNTWQNIYPGEFESNYETMLYIGVQGTNKFFRVNVYMSIDNFNKLMVESF